MESRVEMDDGLIGDECGMGKVTSPGEGTGANELDCASINLAVKNSTGGTVRKFCLDYCATDLLSTWIILLKRPALTCK